MEAKVRTTSSLSMTSPSGKYRVSGGEGEESEQRAVVATFHPRSAERSPRRAVQQAARGRPADGDVQCAGGGPGERPRDVQLRARREGARPQVRQRLDGTCGENAADDDRPAGEVVQDRFIEGRRPGARQARLREGAGVVERAHAVHDLVVLGGEGRPGEVVEGRVAVEADVPGPVQVALPELFKVADRGAPTDSGGQLGCNGSA